MAKLMAISQAFSSLPHPWRALRGRMRRWWLSRQSVSDQHVLTQRNVYILPTGAGWMLGVTLAVLLVASINFGLNLGYLLTFLLAGCAVVGMLVCHATLRGLVLHLLAPEPSFLGHSTPLSVELHNPRPSIRYGIALATQSEDMAPLQWTHTDVPAQGSTSVRIAFTPTHRGWNAVPWVVVETRFPLGTFRVWSWWRAASQVLVYPAPEPHAPPLPPGQPCSGQGHSHSGGSTGEFDGVRAYQRGDALKLVVWKKAAQAFASGRDELVSRDTLHHQRMELWLDVAHCGLSDPEARIARVTAWVLQAERLGLRWGLRLPGGQTIPLGEGSQQRAKCLQALALC